MGFTTKKNHGAASIDCLVGLQNMVVMPFLGDLIEVALIEFHINANANFRLLSEADLCREVK